MAVVSSISELKYAGRAFLLRALISCFLSFTANILFRGVRLLRSLAWLCPSLRSSLTRSPSHTPASRRAPLSPSQLPLKGQVIR